MSPRPDLFGFLAGGNYCLTVSTTLARTDATAPLAIGLALPFHGPWACPRCTSRAAKFVLRRGRTLGECAVLLPPRTLKVRSWVNDPKHVFRFAVWVVCVARALEHKGPGQTECCRMRLGGGQGESLGPHQPRTSTERRGYSPAPSRHTPE